MKTLILAIGFCFCAQFVSAYSFQNLYEDVKKDSKEVFGKEFSTSYFLDLSETGAAMHKIGASTPILAWRFFTLEPAFIYTPDDSNRVGDFGATMPLRVGRIPMKGGKTVSDYLLKKEWVENLFFSPFLSKSLLHKGWGYGFNTGIKF